MKTALPQLWDCEYPSLHTWQKLKRREILRSIGGLEFDVACDLPPMGNTVKKFPLADLVVYRAAYKRLKKKVADPIPDVGSNLERKLTIYKMKRISSLCKTRDPSPVLRLFS